MRLHSTAFSDGARIPREFTCDGKDVSPPLAWDAAPDQTVSYVLLCEDPDAPNGTWHHWAAYDIPADVTALASGAAAGAERQDFRQARNDFHRQGYGGPCPPHGHGPHHYRFRLLALSIARLPVTANPVCGEVERAARKHVLAEARLVGVYER